MTQKISFKLAKLLKEKGYDKMPFYIESKTDYVKGYYCDDDFTDDYIENEFQFEDHVCSHLYLAPTIGEVLDWIFKTYNCWINVRYVDNEVKWQVSLNSLVNGDSDIFVYYDDPYEAYLNGIEQYLTEYINNS